MSITTGLSAVNLGLLWAIMAIGVYLTYRILDFADLTAEGSFTLGAAVAASLIVKGVNPFVATFVAILAGMVAGSITGFLHTKLNIPPLLSGILTMTGLYSINLRIMGKANVPLLRTDTIITAVENIKFNNATIGEIFINSSGRTVVIGHILSSMIVGIICLVLVITLLKLFFNTEIGYAIRATGDNEHMIKAAGENSRKMKVFGLIISNGLIAFAGAIICQENGFADVGMGIGTIVIGLAAVIIGEVLFKESNNATVFIAVVLGAIIYRIIIALILKSKVVVPTDLRLISAVLLSVILYAPFIKDKIFKIKRKAA